MLFIGYHTYITIWTLSIFLSCIKLVTKTNAHVMLSSPFLRLIKWAVFINSLPQRAWVIPCYVTDRKYFRYMNLFLSTCFHSMLGIYVRQHIVDVSVCRLFQAPVLHGTLRLGTSIFYWLKTDFEFWLATVSYHFTFWLCKYCCSLCVLLSITFCTIFLNVYFGAVQYKINIQVWFSCLKLSIFQTVLKVIFLLIQ